MKKAVEDNQNRYSLVLLPEALPTQTPGRQPPLGLGREPYGPAPQGFFTQNTGPKVGDLRRGEDRTLTRPGRAEGSACRGSRALPVRKPAPAKPPRASRARPTGGQPQAAPPATPRPHRARTPTQPGAPRLPLRGCTAVPAACPRPRLCPRRCSRFPSGAAEPLGSPWLA